MEKFWIDSARQEKMILHKPPHLNIYEYAEFLYRKFSIKANIARKRRRRIERTRNFSKKLERQTRTVNTTYIVDLKHDLLQQALMNQLIKKSSILKNGILLIC